METAKRYFRKIIKITAWDSPNVRYGLEQQNAGIEPDNHMVIPGVLSWNDLQKRLSTWTKRQIQIGLKAEFWEGADNLLFPLDWLDRAHQLHVMLKLMEAKGELKRAAKSMGIDTGEGGDETVWSIVDEYGLLYQFGVRTPDTSVIAKTTRNLARDWGVPDHMCHFDRGGGGKQIADQLRSEKFMCKTVAFGSSVDKEHKEGSVRKRRFYTREETDLKEQTYAYFNRRAEMYGSLSRLLDPSGGEVQFTPQVALQIKNSKRITGFAIPPEYEELRRQLSLIPRGDDGEGRLKLPPKNKKSTNSNEVTLHDILGCSPDRADSLVLAVYGLIHEVKRIIVGGR